MGVYVLRRLLQAIVMMFILSIMFFLLVHFQPGGICAFKPAGCEERMHLDQPVADQYLTWLGLLLHGDLGTSNGGQPVSQVILEKLPPTIVLVGVSFVLQQLIALPLGMLAALRQYSFFDQALTLASYVALSLPAFLLGLVLIYLFGVQWQLLPVGHSQDETLPIMWTSDWFGSLRQDPGLLLGDLLRHLLLPAGVLMLTGIAIDSRFMRAAMLQVLHEDYIRTARSKGLKRRTILFKHAFRNAVLPIVTNMALYLPALVGGVILVETVFTWGGIGYLFSSSIGGFGGPDYSVLQALLMLSALSVLVANLLADVTYAWLDPRIHYDAGAGS